MKRTLFVLVAVILFALPASLVGASETGWTLRARAAWVDNDLSYTGLNDVGAPVRSGVDSAVGFDLALEYRTTDRVGIELGVLWAQPDMFVSVAVTEDIAVRVDEGLGFTALMAGVNLHLTPSRPIDAYVGAALAYAMYDNLSFNVGDGGASVGFDSDNELAWGAVVGADIAIGSSDWSASLAVRYLDTNLRVTELDDDGGSVALDFDPIAVCVGLGYRF